MGTKMHVMKTKHIEIAQEMDVAYRRIEADTEVRNGLKHLDIYTNTTVMHCSATSNLPVKCHQHSFVGNHTWPI